MSKTLTHFVNGAQVAGRGDRFGDVFNPATGEVAARVPLASAAETAAAIEAAAAAFPAWRDTPPLRRAAVLFRFKELLDRHLDDLARLVASEHGKLIKHAGTGDIASVAKIPHCSATRQEPTGGDNSVNETEVGHSCKGPDRSTILK